ncbi:hypothetical protein K504DRAFT_484870 [Pleomassaria siparia CBS 279.74]|uniref:Tat pathway signal sequence n=1 Tax=Pleomassaria siparia CBS 279.74 TaxID=1314801 RepID=A0A6G1JWX8_9PLEO|nr:hypothetical protein K504DRAFT_484870 [Pleomassaria siparia CBS 279.74]
MESSKDCMLIGHASDELDAEWSKLMQHFFTEPRKLDEGLQLPNGNYVADYAFMHQLHCLKRIYQSYYPDRYFPNMTDCEKFETQEHNLHCLEMIVEGVRCKADETPLTIRWLYNTPLRTGNRSIDHECVNWDRITEGLERWKVDPFMPPNVFVHPKFGPVVPHRKDTHIENRIGYTPYAENNDYEKYATHKIHVHDEERLKEKS